jgi:phage host-nuclease inhibitor protein Gam
MNNTINTEELLKKAITHFGERSQVLKAIEELGELQLELARHLNGRDNEIKINEELADAYIMIHQMIEIFSKEEFTFFMNAKLNRLNNLIHNN